MIGKCPGPSFLDADQGNSVMEDPFVKTGVEAGIAVEIGERETIAISIPVSIPDSDNAVQAALSGSYPKASSVAGASLLFFLPSVGSALHCRKVKYGPGDA